MTLEVTLNIKTLSDWALWNQDINKSIRVDGPKKTALKTI